MSTFFLILTYTFFNLWFILREEQEKLNVWVALMNLENLYGTQESLVKVFERALKQNEPKKVFFQLISIYTRTDKSKVSMRQRNMVMIWKLL